MKRPTIHTVHDHNYNSYDQIIIIAHAGTIRTCRNNNMDNYEIAWYNYVKLMVLSSLDFQEDTILGSNRHPN